MGVLAKPFVETKQRRGQNLSFQTAAVARLDETESPDNTASRQEAKEHVTDSRHEGNARVQPPDPKECLQMVGPKSGWAEARPSSGSSERGDRFCVRGRDDVKQMKASSDNSQDNMEKKPDTPTKHGAERGAADGDEEDGNESQESPTEMTTEEKEEMRRAVKDGDIDRLEDLLEKPNADIRMVYFQESLLMTAIRAGELQMAEFLLDNGVDQNFTTSLLNVKGKGDNPYQKLEWYEYSCRQMAYDKGFFDIVEIIDILSGRLFPGVKPRQRLPRYRRPPRCLSSTEDASGDDDSDTVSTSTSGDESDVGGSGVTGGSDAATDLRTSRIDGAETLLHKGRRASSKDGLETVPLEGLKHTEVQSIVPTRRNSRWVPEDAEEPATPVGSEALGADSGHYSVGTGAGQTKENMKKTSGRRKKRKKKTTDGEKHPDDRAEEKGTTSRRSGANDHVHEDGAKDVCRSARWLEDSRQQQTDTKASAGDEGYETMSPSPSWPSLRHQHLLLKEQPPALSQTKATKASIVLKRATENHLQRRLVARYTEARPLRWRKVKSAGSYATESPLWHHSLPPHLALRSSSHLDNLSSPSSSSPSSPATFVAEQLPVSITPEFESTRVLDSTNVTTPKILRPSQRTVSSSESCQSDSNSGNGTGLSAARLTTAGALQYPLKQRVPSYMRTTASTFVKCRLEPSFTSSYASLDFVKPPTNGSNGRHHVTSFSAGSSTDTIASVTERRSEVDPLTAAHRGKITQDSQPSPVSPRHAHAPSFRLSTGSDVETSLLTDTVPNIRNNSSVVQAFRQASSLSKAR